MEAPDEPFPLLKLPDAVLARVVAAAHELPDAGGAHLPFACRILHRKQEAACTHIVFAHEADDPGLSAAAAPRVAERFPRVRTVLLPQGAAAAALVSELAHMPDGAWPASVVEVQGAHTLELVWQVLRVRPGLKTLTVHRISSKQVLAGFGTKTAPFGSARLGISSMEHRLSD